MGILDNLENAWDEDFLFESKPMVSTDNMGRPIDDSSLAVKIFSETCCTPDSAICKKYGLNPILQYQSYVISTYLHQQTHSRSVANALLNLH